MFYLDEIEFFHQVYKQLKYTWSTELHGLAQPKQYHSLVFLISFGICCAKQINLQ